MLGATAAAQSTKALNSYISYATFSVPGEEASQYVETYMTFDKGSLVYIKGEKDFNAKINITVLFKQGESIKNYGKYSLTSPTEADMK